jgi:hypothetical protein
MKYVRRYRTEMQSIQEAARNLGEREVSAKVRQHASDNWYDEK